MSGTALWSPEFHRGVADAIVRVWRERRRAFGYDADPDESLAEEPAVRIPRPGEPGLITWAPKADSTRPELSTVAEMTASIGRCYDALPPRGRAAECDGAPAERIALWVVAVGDLGGVARHVLDAARVGILGWRLFVLCPEGYLAERLRAQGSAVLTAPISPADPLAGGLSEVRHAVRTLRPAVVHSHLAYSDFLVAGATVGLPARLFTTEHGIAGDDVVYHGSRWKSRVMEMAHAARLRRFDALIAVAGATLDAVRSKWHPPRGIGTVVIPNGVDAPEELPNVVPGRFHVISLSRLAPEKGLFDLLEAFRLVHGEHPEAHLTLAGGGPLRAELRARIADLGLQEVVAMPGYVEADSLMAEGDVLVQLSTWENCSYTLLDGRVAALAIVATDVGGNGEAMQGGAAPNSRDVVRDVAQKGALLSRTRGPFTRIARTIRAPKLPPTAKFSVIIPTLQRSPRLWPLVEQCVAHPLVGEVIIVNNAQAPLHFDSRKVRVLDQKENIFVNPAWNLGAHEAREDLLAIINDDLLFEPQAFRSAYRALQSGRYAIIGPSESSFNEQTRCAQGVRIAPFFSFKGRFGTFMCLRRTDYVPIPSQIRVWGGDDWLFLQQRRPNGVLTGYRFDTEMGTSSNSPEIQALREVELAAARQVLMPLYRTRWWHRPVEYLDRLRRITGPGSIHDAQAPAV